MQFVEHHRDARVPRPPPSVEVLTPREREVAALVAEGLSNAEIARRLGLIPGTVGNHLGHMLRVLRLKNHVQAAAWAVEHGLWGNVNSVT